MVQTVRMNYLKHLDLLTTPQKRNELLVALKFELNTKAGVSRYIQLAEYLLEIVLVGKKEDDEGRGKNSFKSLDFKIVCCSESFLIIPKNAALRCEPARLLTTTLLIYKTCKSMLTAKRQEMTKSSSIQMAFLKPLGLTHKINNNSLFPRC